MNQRTKNILWVAISIFGVICGYYAGESTFNLTTESETMYILRARVLMPVAFGCIFAMASINLLKK
jgi:peptidoglycan/LPS O-acetylase OafA/YrhL